MVIGFRFKRDILSERLIASYVKMLSKKGLLAKVLARKIEEYDWPNVESKKHKIRYRGVTVKASITLPNNMKDSIDLIKKHHNRVMDFFIEAFKEDSKEMSTNDKNIEYFYATIERGTDEHRAIYSLKARGHSNSKIMKILTKLWLQENEI